MPEFTYRSPVGADLSALEATSAEGVAHYESFAPAGWVAPAERAVLGGPERWWVLAETGGEVAGFAVGLPAANHVAYPDRDPALAHLGGLFVRTRHHGSGVAAELLRRVAAEAGRRGYARGRLYCAAGYARARRFYEREGWQVAGTPFPEPHWGGLELVEYRRECGATSVRRPSS